MSTVLLDFLLVLALLAAIGLMNIRGDLFGPEGPVGLIVLALPLLLIVGGVLASFVSRGLFAWAPGGRFAHYALVLGIVVALATAIALSLDNRQLWWGKCCAAIPLAVIVVCFAILHTSVGKHAAAAVLGTLALSGWVIILGGLVFHIRNSAREADLRARAETLAQEERAKEDQQEFREVATNAPAWKILRYAYSPNESVQKEARAMLAARPNLDDELIAMLREGAGEEAASYIARLHPSPTAKLAPAFAGFLEKELPGWKSRLMGSPNPGMWQPNISSYFDGAERIQRAGGDLRPQLREWHLYLKTVSGMNGMAMHIAPMLQP